MMYVIFIPRLLSRGFFVQIPLLIFNVIWFIFNINQSAEAYIKEGKKELCRNVIF